MSPSPPPKDAHIAIVGAGVFGLSTALHLARRGYTNVTVFDKQPYEKSLYSYANGCDAASADVNKLVRSAYGGQREYQDLSRDALALWTAWNDELRRGGDAVPLGMTAEDVMWVNNGVLSCSDAPSLSDFDRASVTNMEAAGHAGTQLVTSEPAHQAAADAMGMKPALQPFGKDVTGVLDTTGGMVMAERACRFALHKAKRLGVKFVLDAEAGAFVSFTHGKTGEKHIITGIKTADGHRHDAALTIMACGGWTPSLVPSLDGLCETTAGSVFMFQLAKGSPLRERFHHSRFPGWMFNVRSGAEGGLYGFPADEDGVVKIGYRGTKYTNPVVQTDGKERSVPVTRWTREQQVTTVPEQADRVVGSFVDEYLPELKGVDDRTTRLCWYTDSFDNHYVVDHVPDFEGLFVATAGSGHAFKFLPNIGDWVVDVIEGVGLERPAVRAWAWRSLGRGQTPVNRLMEGSKGRRALANVTLKEPDAGK